MLEATGNEHSLATANGCRLDDDGAPSKLHLCLHELLEPIFERYCDKTAIVCGDKSLTFGEVRLLTDRLAISLTKRGISNDDLVGVALDRCVELVPTLLAVMSVGAAWVPIETALPAERISQMMDSARLKLVITGANPPEAFATSTSVCRLVLEEALQTTDANSPSQSRGQVAVKSGDLAYVMYTSGSTGQPKGCENTHGALTNLLLSMQREPGCSETDRLLAITTVSFDMAVVDWFLPLLSGATTIIAQRHDLTDMTALVKLMERHQVTMMQGTPSICQMLLDSGWMGQPRLRQIFLAGELLPRALADRLLDCCDSLWNLYGATESSVYSSIWRVCRNQDVTVGGPIDNTYLYILDENMSPVSHDSPGELCIGGLGVGRGYHNNSEVSRTRFLNNPFQPGLMYRTGDVARFTASGEVTILGRLDSQVKIRGNRVELGDIEAAITAHEDISAAVVIGRDDQLVAYVVQKEGRPTMGDPMAKAAVITRVDRRLRPWLVGRLPAYMVPAFFVEMEALPVSINGKINRMALPNPVTSLRTPTSAVIPASELEGQILLIWSRILGHDHIRMGDNFFEIGGNSLRVVRVHKELERLLGHPVLAAKLFEHYTIKTLAAYLAGASDGGRTPQQTTQQVRDNDEDIAIISMACRLPGGVDTPDSFWDLLESGGDAITDVPEDRWAGEFDLGLDPQGRPYCRRGGFIPSINSFDISFFGISPKEARRLDPAQYMVLETCWEAFELAGYTAEQLRNSQTGVFIGTSNISAHQSLNTSAIRDLADLDGYTVTGSSAGAISGRVSYHLGLQGPTMTIDTACSSSLVTTHLACTSLRLGECDMAVSGGIHLITNPGLHVEFSRLQGMSPDGRCRSFSADTEGTGWAEGSVVVILKRLSDAQRDGDRIHAVIRGTAVNHDGRSASLTAPSGPAQQRLIRRALATARLQSDDIDYVEAHGTATKLGDPIEATALAEVFGPSRAGREPLLIGTAKSNIGHTQAASGLVGLLKVVLAMQHQLLPETLHVSKPTPAVDWQGANMIPVLNNRQWPLHENRLRRAGVSAFGIGGTNAHVIVEEPPRRIGLSDDERSGASSWLARTLPFLLSGDTDTALCMQAEKLHQHLSSPISQDSLADVAYSLATTRSHFRRRLILKARDKDELLEQLNSYAHPDSLALLDSSGAFETPKLAMLFTGQGSQWPGMAKELSEAYPVFDKALREIAAMFDNELEVPLIDVLRAEYTTVGTLLDRTDYAQPALFALETALYQLWQSWGVTPDFVMGHSLGELVAAHVAGIMDLPDTCRLVAARGRLMQGQSGDLRMVSLEASAAEVNTAIEQLACAAEVDIAAYNTPTQTVISGKMDAIRTISSHFAAQNRKTKTLVVGHAFHSRHMDGMLAEFRAVAETVRYNPPKIGVVSSLNGELAKVNQLGTAEYWVRQARETVHFSHGIRALAGLGVNVFLELGPDAVLCGMGAMCLADKDENGSIAWLPSLSRGKDNCSIIQGSLSHLHVRHVTIDWEAYFRPCECRRVQLPTYAFQRQFVVRHERNGTETAISNGNGVSQINGHRPGGSSGSNQFEVAWHRVTMKNSPHGKTWGVLVPLGNSKWATNITATLSQAGIHLIKVEHLKQAEEFEGVICLWDLNDDLLSQTSNVMAEALMYLQTAALAQFKPPVVWVTRQAVGTGDTLDDQTLKLGPGPLLWGLMRTARSEHPELQLRLIDLGDGLTGAHLPPAMMLSGEPECAVRHGRVLVPRLQRVHSVPLAKHRLVRDDGAVLITGALGDLGGRVARWLATDYGVRDLVLTSRHGMDAPGAKQLVAELSKLGVEVTVLASDIANPDDVSSVMATFTTDRPLRGVVHAAGVVDSGVLSTMTHQRCETTIAPKAYGAWNLHQATQAMDLDLFMMFSSISGVMGMPGLANYAAANTYLDSLAHLRHAQGLPATSVAYGTWAGDAGMASKLGAATVAHLAQYGLDPLPPDDGLQLFQQAVVSGRPLTMAAVLDLERLREYLEEQGGGIPPLLRALMQDNTVTKAANSSASRRHLREMLSDADPEQRAGIMLNMVRQVVAKALGFAHPHGVEIDRPLKDIGIDSLTAVQMRNHLATVTGLTLSVNIVFLHPNLKTLSQTLLAQLQATDTPGSTVPSTNQLNMTVLLKGCLDPNFTFDNQSSLIPTPPGSVLLTGATGFVGAFILHELLKLGIPTYCLVRASDTSTAQQRLLSTLQGYGLWEPEYAPLVIPIVGDISQPLLGVTEQVFNDLSQEVSAVVHSAALVDWLRPMDDYVGPNIVSAHEVLRLASRGRAKAVHLVSTISTLTKHMGLDLKEGDLEYGYGTSKYIAERLVAAARWRGAKACIYRLPYVTASASGQFRSDKGDFLHNLLSGCLEMGLWPEVKADMSAVLPVDYLAETIVGMMTTDSCRLGSDFDFLSTRAPSCTDFFEKLGNLNHGKKERIVRWSEWKERALEHAAAHATSHIAKIAAVLDEFTEENVASMFKGLPLGKNVLGGDEYPAPELGENFVTAYLGKIRSKGGE